MPRYKNKNKKAKHNNGQKTSNGKTSNNAKKRNNGQKTSNEQSINKTQNPQHFIETKNSTLKQNVETSYYVSSAVRFADFHVHILDNSDGVYTMSQALEVAILNNVANVALLQHNSLDAWRSFTKEHNLPRNRAIYKINGVNAIPAVEITCRDTENTNYKGNPVKMHLVVMAPLLTNDSPLVRLLKIKAENDNLVDYGLLNYVASANGITLDHETIKNYVIERRKEVAGFNTFGTRDVIEFFKKNNITIAKSQRELEKLLDKAPRVQRLNLDLKDVIEIAHASGALVIFAHPSVNLKRTATPEKTIQNFLQCGGDGLELITNSMDEEYFKIIMDSVKRFAPNGNILFTGGSDTHIAGEDVTIGKTTKGYITEQSQSKVIQELQMIDTARARGALSNRDYKIDINHVEEIISKYAELEKEYEKAYSESKNKMIDDYNRANQNTVFARGEELSPLDFKTFIEYMEQINSTQKDVEETEETEICDVLTYVIPSDD